MPENPPIVCLATAWGSKHGGINSFSTDLCRSLAQILTTQRLIVVVPFCTRDDRADARSAGIALISLAETESDSTPVNSEKTIALLKNTGVEHVVWWIGHDHVTGKLALDCQKSCPGSKAAIFMHSSFQDYAFIKHTPDKASAIEVKASSQREVLERADLAIAIGPLLLTRLKEIRGDRPCLMLIPGLAPLPQRMTTSSAVQAITFGRFEESEFLVKQAPLAVEAFARAFRIGVEASSPAWKSACLQITGVPPDLASKFRERANTEANRVVNLIAHDFVTDPEKLRSQLSQSNVCLMLSWHEGFGLTGWEAIGNGVPLVLSRNSGLFELLQQLGGTVTGCVYPIDIRGLGDGEPNGQDVEAVSKALQAIASDLPKARRDAWSLRTDLRSTHGFSWRRTASDFAKELGLELTTTILDTLVSGSDPALTTPNSFDSANLSSAQKLLAVAESNYQCGQYTQALEALSNLRDLPGVGRHPGLAIDAATKEAEILMRLNKYRPAQSLVQRIAIEAQERGEDERYIRCRLVEITINLDLGRHGEASQLASDLHSRAQEKSPEMIESTTRTIARAMALNGECSEALIHANNALKLASDRKDQIAIAKSHYALGQAYRHGRNDSLACEHYELAGDISSKSGHTDCFIWSILGQGDSLSLTGDMSKARDLFSNLEKFLGQHRVEHPLEMLHLKLSLTALDIAAGQSAPALANELLLDYESRGVMWPRGYLEAIASKGFTSPKLF